MQAVIERSLEALSAARVEFAQARRRIALSMGLLFLVHLLTVYPYLKLQRSSQILEAKLEKREELAEKLDTSVAALDVSGNTIKNRLQSSLKDGTQRMIDEFTLFRHFFKKAQNGELGSGNTPTFETEVPHMQEAEFEGQLPQQMQSQTMPAQMQTQTMPQQMQQPEHSNSQTSELSFQRPWWVGPIFIQIALDIDEGKPDARARLIDYARNTIVEPAYAVISRNWENILKPTYLKSIQDVESDLQELLQIESENSGSFREALTNIVSTKESLKSYAISSENQLDNALKNDWWNTVEGKNDYAEALNNQVSEQLEALLTKVQEPINSLKEVIEDQKLAREVLNQELEKLNIQFETQIEQLGNLTGAGGFMPVDLIVFIGLFPLIIGCVPGFFLFRAAWAMRDSAALAEDLIDVPGDHIAEARWHAVRLLTDGSTKNMTILIIVVLMSWIFVSGVHLLVSPIQPLVKPYLTIVIAIVVVVVPTSIVLNSIKRLEKIQGSNPR